MKETVKLAHEALLLAIEKCYKYDKVLIERNMERASVARIFYYLQDIIEHEKRFTTLKKYNIDLEYNKNKEHIKKTPRFREGIQPDLLVHVRGSNKENILVVEFKSQNGNMARMREYDNKPRDFVKLEDMTCLDVYNYPLGLFVRLNNKGAETHYFIHGKECSEQDAFI